MTTTASAARAILRNQHPARERRPAPDRLRAFVTGASWLSIVTGLLMGAVIGLWSFDGPVAAPAGFEDPSALARRLLRLSHIAFIALPALNILHLHFGRCAGAPAERVCFSLLAGSWLLPITLAIAAWWPVAKYALPFPATLILIPSVLAATNWMRVVHDERSLSQ
jgi:hypothetical protein